MKNNTPNEIRRTDRRISEMLDKQLSKAPVTPWFTRKVMNRLPPRRRPLFSAIEICSYVVTIMIILLALSRRIRVLFTAPDTFTVGDMLIVITLSLFMIVVWALLVIPILKRNY